ncbi:hypothetical protein, partial [Ferrovum myxofaciens]|uniref:hypothetical protein n=1 Tax=Ferrovum myxofaciens TaxID=416213 RepID=UPI001F15BBF6
MGVFLSKFRYWNIALPRYFHQPCIEIFGKLNGVNIVPDYVSISVRAISFFPEQGVAHMSATASLGTIAARSNCCISGN